MVLLGLQSAMRAHKLIYSGHFGSNMLLKWLARKILSAELLDQYMKGVKDGVNQHYHEPETAVWMITEVYE